MYKAAQGRERVRIKVAGGANAFGDNNEGRQANVVEEQHSNPPIPDNDVVGHFEACFDNLANVAKVERTTLDELVKNNEVLTTSNVALVAENREKSAKINKLEARIRELEKAAGGNGGNSERVCRHCKNKGTQGKHRDITTAWNSPKTQAGARRVGRVACDGVERRQILKITLF